MNNNLCNNCFSYKVCSIRKDFTSLCAIYNNDISVNLEHCRNYIGADTSIATDVKANTEKPNLVVNKNNKSEDIIDAFLEDLVKKEISKDVKSKSILTEEEIKKYYYKTVDINKEKKELYKCPNCGTTDYKDGLFKCEECNKIVCLNCGVHDNTSNKYLCEECW